MEYRNGVKASLTQCLSLTITERITILDLSKLNTERLRIAFNFTWGLDGSGDHSDYHQLSKLDYTTKQVMSVCFSLREVQLMDDKGSKECWKSSLAGSNKPQHTRPLALFPEKECSEMLKDFVPLVENEIDKIKQDGLDVAIDSCSTVKANCGHAKLAMADGKMVVTLLNLGGASCTMCTKDQRECQKVKVIE